MWRLERTGARAIELSSEQPKTIGREDVGSDDRSVSRLHAALLVSSGSVELKSVSSSKTTAVLLCTDYLSWRHLKTNESITLQHGDEVSLHGGDSTKPKWTLRFRKDAPPDQQPRLSSATPSSSNSHVIPAAAPPIPAVTAAPPVPAVTTACDSAPAQMATEDMLPPPAKHPRLSSDVPSSSTSHAKYSCAPGKPVCSYGRNCYRKNPQHFEEEDHPADHPLIAASGIQESSPLPMLPPKPADMPGGVLQIDSPIARLLGELGEPPNSQKLHQWAHEAEKHLAGMTALTAKTSRENGVLAIDFGWHGWWRPLPLRLGGLHITRSPLLAMGPYGMPGLGCLGLGGSAHACLERGGEQGGREGSREGACRCCPCLPP